MSRRQSGGGSGREQGGPGKDRANIWSTPAGRPTMRKEVRADYTAAFLIALFSCTCTGAHLKSTGQEFDLLADSPKDKDTDNILVFNTGA